MGTREEICILILRIKGLVNHFIRVWPSAKIMNISFLSHSNKTYIYMNSEWSCIWPRFEKEVKGNSEMAIGIR